MASEELLKFAEENGIDVSGLLGGGDVDRVVVGWNPGRPRGDGLPPKYRDPSPKTSPVDQVLKDFYKQDDRSLSALQERLYAGGFYGSLDRDQIRFGDHDEATLAAYERAVNRASAFFAAGRHVTLDEVIDSAARFASERQKQGSPGRQRAPLTFNLPNPADVAQGINQTARAEIGKLLNDDAMRAYVAEYQQKIAQYQKTAYSIAETGGSVVEPPSLATFAQEKLKKDRPSEVFETDLLGAFNQLAQMIGSVNG